jgi:hypothetical protein
MDEGRLKMDQEKEVCRLAAESLATETLLVALLSRFAHLDAAMRATIADALTKLHNPWKIEPLTLVQPLLRTLSVRSALLSSFGLPR